jgi:signal transduction histidine kinase
MENHSRRAWLALSCIRDGAIVQVLRDDLGLAPAAGARFTEIVDTGSARKAENLLAALATREALAGWQLNVPSGDTARTLLFAAAANTESILILGASGPDSLTQLFDDLGAPSDALATLLRDQRSGFSASMSRDNELYEELSRLNNELINRERELARKSAALERLSAEKSRMAAIAAHDLRNPLTIISAYAILLKAEHAVSGEHLLFVEEIERSARFMMELVEEMLEVSTLETARVDLDLRETDLVVAAQHAATINRLRAERKNITVAFEPETDRASIHADAVKLRQIINNLVVNAIKFSPPRSEVVIRVRRTDDRAVLEVQDHGIGIPPEHLNAIFQPFTTFGSVGTAGEKSTGLGLSIVKQLADLHRATVEVESEEGRGSVFRVGFPAIR